LGPERRKRRGTRTNIKNVGESNKGETTLPNRKRGEGEEIKKPRESLNATAESLRPLRVWGEKGGESPQRERRGIQHGGTLTERIASLNTSRTFTKSSETSKIYLGRETGKGSSDNDKRRYRPFLIKRGKGRRASKHLEQEGGRDKTKTGQYSTGLRG